MPKFFEICHSPLHLHSTNVPDKLGTVHMAPGLAPGHSKWTQTVPDLNCLAIFGPSPPQPRRAARCAPRSLIGPHPRPQPRRTRAALTHPSTCWLGRPRWAGFTPHASMVPYPTCRPRRGRSGSGCSRRLPSGCTVQRRTSITVGEAECSRASRQIKHHKASSRHCSPSVGTHAQLQRACGWLKLNLIQSTVMVW